MFGLLSADRGQHDLFTLQGAGRWTLLWKLQMPAAMPAIFAGFRIAAGLSVIGAVVGELFFKQGDKGIGILMDTYRSRLNNPLMYGCLILAAALGIAVFMIFGFTALRADAHTLCAAGSLLNPVETMVEGLLLDMDDNVLSAVDIVDGVVLGAAGLGNTVC